MTYNIIGIFPTIDDAISAANRLAKAGYIKQFSGFTANTKFQPESLVEDHFVDQNEIIVYTPNLNRAFKAKNILKKFGADIKRANWFGSEKIQRKQESPTHLSPIKTKKQQLENKSQD
ncbi:MULTISPECIES: hypothetical protein [unclassified Kaistella]|uniref:hypothetical protein n=1 Tax=unclassified Kaistella TaxID=2762626 RepID=UPI0027335516|nr:MULTISPECIES: hypothetical protein [unclassified Kaistella]MDP2454761.1 hypothetical protein [Kaistella sp. SH11-4b]MDP2457498.1 hypothetical protein [Kaistella sp. SH40-3]MDP2460258.1 hypothetical protein [Kaistella sp. SH19-2b]